MKIEIRLGTQKDIDSIANLYDDINDYLDSTTNYPGWKKGIYPTRQDAIAGVEEEALYVAMIQDDIVGSFILRHKPEKAYMTATWQADLAYENVWVIYTFVVSPDYLQHGVGQKMLEYAVLHGRSKNIKALRLDVYEKNKPAISLYEKCGFQYIDTVSLGLEEYGLDWFQLYEKLL